jgi:hypothetical protein
MWLVFSVWGGRAHIFGRVRAGGGGGLTANCRPCDENVRRPWVEQRNTRCLELLPLIEDALVGQAKRETRL